MDDLTRARTTFEIAEMFAQFMRRLFRKEAPPPDGWSIELRLTTLGGLQLWIPSRVPAEVRLAAYTIVPVIAWLYPGPMESKLIRENENLRAEIYSARRRIDQLEDERVVKGKTW